MDFIDKFKEYSIDDIEMIIENKKDLYSKDEIIKLSELLKVKKASIIESNLPDTILCSKCEASNKFSDDICEFCGNEMDKDKYYAALDGYYNHVGNDGNEKKIKKSKKHIYIKVMIAISIIIIAIVVFLVVIMVQRNNLKDSLIKEWYSTSNSLILVLDISNDEIEYRSESYLIGNYTFDTFDWKVIDGNTIKVNRFGDEYTNFDIEISEDGKGLTITPALTSSDPYEKWVIID